MKLEQILKCIKNKTKKSEKLKKIMKNKNIKNYKKKRTTSLQKKGIRIQ